MHILIVEWKVCHEIFLQRRSIVLRDVVDGDVEIYSTIYVNDESSMPMVVQDINRHSRNRARHKKARPFKFLYVFKP